MKSFVTLSAAALALVASSASFAAPATNDIEFGYDAQAVVTNVSRAEVKTAVIANRAASLPAGEKYGEEVTPTNSTVTREEVRKEAIEHARSHKRELAELA